jgi:uncharacterized membrane protein YhiD involved in acid resistance
MEMDNGMIWDAILSVFVPVAVIVVRSLSSRLEKTEDLMARTREEYATKYEMTNNTNNMMAAMRRLEDKIDSLLKKG